LNPKKKSTPPAKPEDFKSFKDFCEKFYPIDKFPRRKRCPHPNCPENDRDPWIDEYRECTLHKPIWISIPAGEHIHIECPVHPGGHILRGSNIRYEIQMDKDDWGTPRWWKENNLPGKVWM